MNFHLLFLSCACVAVTSSTVWCPCLDSCSSTGSLTHHCFCTISTIVSTVKETSNCLILFWNIVLIWKTPWKGLESPTLGSMDHILGTTVIRNTVPLTLIGVPSPCKECFMHCMFLRSVCSVDFFHPAQLFFYSKLINVSLHTVRWHTC